MNVLPVGGVKGHGDILDEDVVIAEFWDWRIGDELCLPGSFDFDDFHSARHGERYISSKIGWDCAKSI